MKYILIGNEIIEYIKVKGCKWLGLPEFLDNRHMKAGRFSAIHTGRFCARGHPRNSFVLQAESTPWS